MYFLGGLNNPNYAPQTELEKFLHVQPYDYEYVNLAYPENPLMKGWPKEIKKAITQKKSELAQKLEEKEKLLLIHPKQIK